MRNVALDLGNRISYCEVAGGKVIKRATVESLGELMSLLGPQTKEARVAIEACREAWAVDDKLREWGARASLGGHDEVEEARHWPAQAKE